MESLRYEVYAVLIRNGLSADITCRTTHAQHANMVIGALKEVDGITLIHRREVLSRAELVYEGEKE